jgi:penicillin amidase
MKRFLKIIKIVVLTCVFIFVAAWLYSRTLQPTYNGELSLKNLSENVSVHFDDNGVPHINAQSQKDAYTALGYVHAQDRLWQMELIRRIAPGRLSELFGKELLDTDIFFSGLGIEEAAAVAINNLDKSSEAYLLAQAYLDGINQYIEIGKTPLEFSLVGVKKEKYTIKDIYNVLGYMSFSFAVAHKTDPLLTEIKEKLGNVYLDEILGSHPENLTINRTDSISKIHAKFSKSVSLIMDKMPVSPLIGSNSGLLEQIKQKTGKLFLLTILTSDFHNPLFGIKIILKHQILKCMVLI